MAVHRLSSSVFGYTLSHRSIFSTFSQRIASLLLIMSTKFLPHLRVPFDICTLICCFLYKRHVLWSCSFSVSWKSELMGKTLISCFHILLFLLDMLSSFHCIYSLTFTSSVTLFSHSFVPVLYIIYCFK